MPIIFASTLPRAFRITFEKLSPQPELKQDSLDRILAQIKECPPRPGLIEGVKMLQDAGFETVSIVLIMLDHALMLFT